MATLEAPAPRDIQACVEAVLAAKHGGHSPAVLLGALRHLVAEASAAGKATGVVFSYHQAAAAHPEAWPPLPHLALPEEARDLAEVFAQVLALDFLGTPGGTPWSEPSQTSEPPLGWAAEPPRRAPRSPRWGGRGRGEAATLVCRFAQALADAALADKSPASVPAAAHALVKTNLLVSVVNALLQRKDDGDFAAAAFDCLAAFVELDRFLAFDLVRAGAVASVLEAMEAARASIRVTTESLQVAACRLLRHLSVSLTPREEIDVVRAALRALVAHPLHAEVQISAWRLLGALPKQGPKLIRGFLAGMDAEIQADFLGKLSLGISRQWRHAEFKAVAEPVVSDWLHGEWNAMRSHDHCFLLLLASVATAACLTELAVNFFDLALDNLPEEVQSRSDDTIKLAKASRLATLQGRSQEAIKVAKECVFSDVDWGLGWYCLGLAYAGHGLHADAAEAIGNALLKEKDPMHREIFLRQMCASLDEVASYWQGVAGDLGSASPEYAWVAVAAEAASRDEKAKLKATMQSRAASNMTSPGLRRAFLY